MRLSGSDTPPVAVRLIEHAGSVKVAVRSADGELTRDMQNGLGELLNGLEHRGFEAEVWAPAASGNERLQTTHNALDNGSGNANRWEDGQRQHGENQQQGRNRPKWVAELNRTILERNKGEQETWMLDQ